MTHEEQQTFDAEMDKNLKIVLLGIVSLIRGEKKLQVNEEMTYDERGFFISKITNYKLVDIK